MARTPFPVPFGWYQVCWPDELEPGGVAPLYLFGRDLVLWRDTEAGYSVSRYDHGLPVTEYGAELLARSLKSEMNSTGMSSPVG